MSDFKNPDAGWYFDQYEAICKAGGRVSRGQFVSTCHIFRAAGYNEALAAAGSEQERTAAHWCTRCKVDVDAGDVESHFDHLGRCLMSNPHAARADRTAPTTEEQR